MLDKQVKTKLLKNFQLHEGDTGSPEIQIAFLTEEINSLVNHLKTHKKDFSSRYGLLKKVGERRRLMKYLDRTNPESLKNIAKKLKLKIGTKPSTETVDIESKNLKQIQHDYT